MPGLLSAIVTVVCWGTWLIVSQVVRFRSQQIRTFYIAAANLVMATGVYLIQGAPRMDAAVFWVAFAGGVIWAVSGLCAFIATDKIGLVRAVGIWTPLNIIVSLIWGAVLFHEFLKLSPFSLVILLVSLVAIVGGILTIILARGEEEKPRDPAGVRLGLLGALGAGVLWGSYYVPIKFSSVSMWTAAFPLALGIFAASTLLVLFPRVPLRLDDLRSYVRVGVSGVLWSIGNYSMLVLVEQLGAGRGFTIAQLGVVINAFVGVYFLKDPKPGTRAAALIVGGSLLATLGGVILGNLK